MAGALYNWASSQFLGIIWNMVEKKQHLYFGRDPISCASTGSINGFNDKPYMDRVLACLEEG